MKGYIYITGMGIDPGKGHFLNDPIFSDNGFLGACMPNIRRHVETGDHIFVVSGKSPGVNQYVIGGIEVAEKIDALAAYQRFPENRLNMDNDGNLIGNIIVDSTGEQHPLDRHSKASFGERVQNYIVGRNPVSLTNPASIEKARNQTLNKLQELFDKPGNRAVDIIGRGARKLTEQNVRDLRDWLDNLKSD